MKCRCRPGTDPSPIYFAKHRPRQRFHAQLPRRTNATKCARRVSKWVPQTVQCASLRLNLWQEDVEPRAVTVPWPILRWEPTTLTVSPAGRLGLCDASCQDRGLEELYVVASVVWACKEVLVVQPAVVAHHGVALHHE
eukprot:633515-Amphidinium_carterae.1